MTSRAVGLAAALALFTGCGTPELELVFSVPPPYGDAIQEVVLKIYAPRGSSAFDCEALAFGRVEEGVSRGSLVDEIRVRDEGVLPLSDVDRAGDKVFLVDGLDAEGAAVVRGCEMLGEVDRDVTVTVTAEPATRLSLVDAPSLSRPVGAPLEGPITLRVTDVLDVPIPELLVRWELIGVGGVASTGEVRTDGLGEVAISPALPTRAGPFELDVSVRWALPGPPVATGFVAPRPELVTLPGPVIEYRTGDVGPSAERGFAALLESDVRGEVQVAIVYRADGAVQTAFSPRIPGPGARLGLFDFREQRDQVLVVTRDEWLEVAPDGILTERQGYRPPTRAAPQAVLPTGPCQGTPDSPQVLVTYAADAVGFFDLEANYVGGFGQRLDVFASGCVDDQDGVPIRTLVIDGGDQVGLVVAAEVSPSLYVTRPWVAVGSGTAFSPPVGETGRLLLGTQLNVNDFVVSRASWTRDGEAVELRMEGLDSPPEIPVVNRGGDVDGDGTLDVVSLFGRQTLPGGPVRWSVWGVLGQTRRGRRMSGTYELPEATRANPTLMVLDFDEDGVDDLLVGERLDPLGTPRSETRVEVYSMGLAVQ